MVAAGRLNRNVIIQRPAAGADELGQPVAGWVEVCSPWASIKHMTGLQAIRADADTSIVKASIRIRYRRDVDAGMRVVHGTTVYNITAVLPDEVRREHLDLVCEAVGGSA